MEDGAHDIIYNPALDVETPWTLTDLPQYTPKLLLDGRGTKRACVVPATWDDYAETFSQTRQAARSLSTSTTASKPSPVAYEWNMPQQPEPQTSVSVQDHFTGAVNLYQHSHRRHAEGPSDLLKRAVGALQNKDLEWCPAA